MKIFAWSSMMFLNLAAASALLAADAPTREMAGTRPDPEGHPTVVEAALYIVDVSRVDAADQSFTADVVLSLAWRDHRLESIAPGTSRRFELDEVWYPNFQILNQRRVFKQLPDQVDVSSDGQVTYQQRFYGQFSAPLDLHDFPLDHQRFRIQVVTPRLTEREIAFGLGGDEDRIARAPSFTVPDWTMGPVDARLDAFEVVPGGRSIAGFTVEFAGRRHIGFYVGKAFVSVAIIVFMSWVVFWVEPSHLAPRMSVSVTSMLTLVAYRFLLGGVLPPVSYLTRLDYFLLASTALVFLALIEVAVVSRLVAKGRVTGAEKLDLSSRFCFPAAFLTIFVVVFWVK